MHYGLPPAAGRAPRRLAAPSWGAQGAPSALATGTLQACAQPVRRIVVSADSSTLRVWILE